MPRRPALKTASALAGAWLRSRKRSSDCDTVTSSIRSSPRTKSTHFEAGAQRSGPIVEVLAQQRREERAEQMADDGGVAVVEGGARLEDRFCRPEDLPPPQLAAGAIDRVGNRLLVHRRIVERGPAWIRVAGGAVRD
ncbi:MAG: hypothetical protein J2P48_16380 [Alphaproteobacteria bacterium]|nr:hypothetical protein [Alphaproteobacteria bacterium]